jgi:methyl-accepting chemotaxis protein
MSKWSLNTKIFGVILIFIVASILIASVGIMKMNAINEALNQIVDIDAKRLNGVQELRAHLLSLVIDEKNIILEEKKEEMDKISARLLKTNAETDLKIEEMLKIASEAGKKNYAELSDAKKAWFANNQEIQKLAFSGDDKAATKLSVTTGRTLRLKMEEIVNGVVERNKKRMEVASDETDAIYANAKMMMISTSILAILLGCAVAFFIMRAVSNSIDQVITQLTDNSNQVTSASSQIAASAEELSQAATEQSASLEETSASIEEMNSMVQKNADNAKKTTEIAEHSKDNAGRGKEVVVEMMKAINDINTSNDTIKESVDESNKRIAEIVDVITEIGNKTKVINDIVFQTKLLSFNASVEAARAGEHGKGFAVVAEEVGNLAQMSGNAAKEITTMLDESILKVQNIVSETKTKIEHLIIEGKTKVDTGIKIAQNCGSVLDDIVLNISNVTSMSGEISVACQEQAQGVNEITKAMAQLDQVTQTNAATSEEAAQAAEELSAQAESLRSVVNVLVETIKGSSGSSSSSGSIATYAPTTTQKKSGNVLPMKKPAMTKTAAVKPAVKTVTKKASGDGIPSHHDSRFEEV